MRSSSRTPGTPTPARSPQPRTARWRHGRRRSASVVLFGPPHYVPLEGAAVLRGGRLDDAARRRPGGGRPPGRRDPGRRRPRRPSPRARALARGPAAVPPAGAAARVLGPAGGRRRDADGRRRRPRQPLSGAGATRSSSCRPTSATISTTQRRARLDRTTAEAITGLRPEAIARRRGLRLPSAARPRRARAPGRSHDRAPRARHLGGHVRRPLPGGRLRGVRRGRVERSPAPRDVPGDTGT